VAKNRLLQFAICESEWSVICTTAALAPQLEGCMGKCVFEHNLILIDSELSRDEQLQTLVHELVHACLHVSEAGVVLLRLLEVNGELWHDFEEVFVRLLAVPLADLPIIKSPRGWVQLTDGEVKALVKGKGK
jgi:hypothetical protein